MKVQFYQVNPSDNDASLATHYVGFTIPEKQIQKWTNAYPGADPGGNELVDPLTVNAQCHVGAKHPTKDSTVIAPYDYIANVTKQYSGTGDMTVAVKLPENPAASNDETYTCNFGFEQTSNGIFHSAYTGWKKTGV